MSFNKATCRFSLFAVVITLSITSFFVSESAAQDQYCECLDAYQPVSVVHRAPVRRTSVRKYRKSKRSAVAVRRTTRVVRQPVYETVYVPVREVNYAPSYVAYDDDDCDDEAYTTTSRVVVKQRANRNVYYNSGYGRTRVYTSTAFGEMPVDADYYSTARIASDYGYRDGFKDGHEVGMEREAYFPQKEGDFRNATNGYEGHFGSKYLYKEAYRDAYLRGYDAGFRSVAQRSTYRASRY